MAGLGDIADGARAFFDILNKPSNEAGQSYSQSTRVIASFHSDHGFDGVVDSTPEIAGVQNDQPFRIVGITTNKMFGGPGSWTLTVKARYAVDVRWLWDDPEDTWVRLVIVKNGIPNEVMFGLLNTVTQSKVRSDNGSLSVTYLLRGSDFHKVFSSSQVYVNIHDNAGQVPQIAMYDAVKENLRGSPDKMVRAILHNWLGDNGLADKIWRLPRSLGGKFFYDILTLDFQECRGETYAPGLFSPDLMMGKTLWPTMLEYSNPMLNELYVTMPVSHFFDRSVLPQPKLVLREHPWPSKDKGSAAWDGLRTHDLSPAQIRSSTLSRGAPESQFNYWLLESVGLQGRSYAAQQQLQAAAHREGGIPGGVPIYSLEGIQQHGFRRFFQSTIYLPVREDPAWYAHAPHWMSLLHDWYVVVPYEMSGTIQCSMVEPGIQLGERVRAFEADNSGELSTPSIYYVEGVTHSWQYPQASTTTLNVTRGEPEDVDLLAIAYRQYEGQDTINVAAAVPTEILAGTPLADEVPHGSGTRMDKQVGQVDTPERLFLKRRGKLGTPSTAVDRGELDSLPEDRITAVNPGDLPDQQVPDEAEIAVGRAQPRERTQGGNLTQRELESGRRLPAKLDGSIPKERSTEDADTAIDRWKRGKKK